MYSINTSSLSSSCLPLCFLQQLLDAHFRPTCHSGASDEIKAGCCRVMVAVSLRQNQDVDSDICPRSPEAPMLSHVTPPRSARVTGFTKSPVHKLKYEWHPSFRWKPSKKLGSEQRVLESQYEKKQETINTELSEMCEYVGKMLYIQK